MSSNTSWTFPNLMELEMNPWLGQYALPLAGTLFACLVTARILNRPSAIPYVGPWYHRWFRVAALKCAARYLVEGHDKYPNSIFRTALFPWSGEVIIVNGPKLIEELRSAPDDVFCFEDWLEKELQVHYTMGSQMITDSYHLPVIRTTLTKNLDDLLPAVMEEIEAAFSSLLGGNNWKKFPVQSTMVDIVCRVSGRVMVGEPLCHNKEYQSLSTNYTIGLVVSAFGINLFPSFLHPVVGRLFSRRSSYVKRMGKLLEGEIESRRKSLELYGKDWAEKPNDALTWLMEQATPGREQTVPYLANRMLFLNFAAIHTTSSTFSHALLHLAANPEFADILREEVTAIIDDEGWTKSGLQKMTKVDSFLRESARMNSIIMASLGRHVRKDYTFKNGVTVPRGSYIAASAYSAHMDKDVYSEPEVFKPWRFLEGEGIQHQMIVTGADYLVFGLGRHACPGRFFAVNELKALLCYVVLNFEVSLPEGCSGRPKNEHFGHTVLPNSSAEVIFKTRA